jgi:hypothetical protein
MNTDEHGCFLSRRRERARVRGDEMSSTPGLSAWGLARRLILPHPTLSLPRLSKNAKIPFDELRVSGKILSKMDIKPLRLSLSKPRFGENRHPLPRERAFCRESRGRGKAAA